MGGTCLFDIRIWMQAALSISKYFHKIDLSYIRLRDQISNIKIYNMRRKIITGSVITAFIAVFFYFSIDQITPKEIENAPEWTPLETAFAEVQGSRSDRLILIDIYEVGCRFCRQMEREVYPSESIRTLLDQRFIPVKINGNSDNTIHFNGESMTEQQFANKMGLTAFPFTVVMDSDGNVLKTRRGYMGVVELSRFLNDVLREV